MATALASRSKRRNRSGSPIADKDYRLPLRFSGKVEKVTLTIDRRKLSPEDITKLEAAAHDNPANNEKNRCLHPGPTHQGIWKFRLAVRIGFTYTFTDLWSFGSKPIRHNSIEVQAARREWRSLRSLSNIGTVSFDLETVRKERTARPVFTIGIVTADPPECMSALIASKSPPRLISIDGSGELDNAAAAS